MRRKHACFVLAFVPWVICRRPDKKLAVSEEGMFQLNRASSVSKVTCRHGWHVISFSSHEPTVSGTRTARSQHHPLFLYPLAPTPMLPSPTLRRTTPPTSPLPPTRPTASRLRRRSLSLTLWLLLRFADFLVRGADFEGVLLCSKLLAICPFSLQRYCR